MSHQVDVDKAWASQSESIWSNIGTKRAYDIWKSYWKKYLPPTEKLEVIVDDKKDVRVFKRKNLSGPVAGMETITNYYVYHYLFI